MSKMVSPFASITKKEIESQIMKQAVTEIYEEGDENWFGSFNRWSMDLNLSMKMVTTFLFKMQIKSCINLFSWHVHK